MPPPHLQSVGDSSLASVECALRVLLGRPPVVVQGEIITKKNDKGATLYEGRLATPDLDKLIQDLAFDLYRHLDPLRAAYAAWDLDDIEDMRIALLAELERRRGALKPALRHAEQATAVAPTRRLGLYVKGRIQRGLGRRRHGRPFWPIRQCRASRPGDTCREGSISIKRREPRPPT